MNVYCINVNIIGTAYIKAETAADALRKAWEQLNGVEILVAKTYNSEVQISKNVYDSPDFPEVSLSPAMVLHGPVTNETPELVAEDVLVEGEEEPAKED